MKTLQQYFNENNFTHSDWVRDIIICNDGFKISIQASEFHYCTPRKSGLKKYSTVELGYPSKKDILIIPYVEEKHKPKQTVYPYVPFKLAELLIKNHGGIKEPKKLKTLTK